MPIEFPCCLCGKLLRTPDETTGRSAKCPSCGAVTTVPEATESFYEAGPPVGGEGSPFGASGTGATESGEAGYSSFDGEGLPQDSTNPYQAPGEYDTACFHKAPPRERVRIPAICLIVVASLGLVVLIFNLGYAIVLMSNGINVDEIALQMGIQIGSCLIGLILRAIVLVGAIKMKNLQNYGLAMAAAIIAIIPCFSGCCLLEMPFGIWALVVLSDANVRVAFR